MALHVHELKDTCCTNWVTGNEIRMRPIIGRNSGEEFRMVSYFTNYKTNFIFGRASDLYLFLYNQLFALFHYVFKFLTP